MATIVEIIYRDYLWPHKRKILIFFLLLLFILVSVFAYKKYAQDKMKKKPYHDVANANHNQEQVQILFFSTEWCPYCKKAQPEWDKFTQKNSIVNNYKLVCTKMDCTNGDDADVKTNIQKYDIQHYPTVKMLFKGDIIDFDSKITEESLTKFVNSILNE
jgi:thiol-disulfide isomerase/thioredoxin